MYKRQTTFFFHLIPGLTETFTRLPTGAPLFSSPEDPALQKTVGACFAVLIVGCLLQVRRLRAESAPTAAGLAQPQRPSASRPPMNLP